MKILKKSENKYGGLDDLNAYGYHKKILYVKSKILFLKHFFPPKSAHRISNHISSTY